MAARKSSSKRKYGKGASKKVGRALHKKKKGTLKSGRSKKKVTSKKQAIAIGLSEARKEGKKVPKKAKKSTKKAPQRKKKAAKKASPRKSAKKSSSKKSARKR